jgi:hypothetical protein
VRRNSKSNYLITVSDHIPFPQALRRTLALTVTTTAIACALSSMAYAAGATLGSQAQTASQDLTTGGGFVLELIGYILGVGAMIAGGFTIWQHTKNPNGQHRMSYGIISVLAGGFFLALSTMAQFSSNTVSGGNATNTGTSQQLTIQ